MSVKSPWAILLTKWSDNATEPRSIDFYRNLFTSAGGGTFNMTDYFAAMSHGSLDMSGNKVFGWFTLNVPQTNYGTTLDRNGLLNAAKTLAIQNGVDLSKFAGVVVVMNTPTDLCGWLGGMAALCDHSNCFPTVLGQEMGHGYGLNHSRQDGSTGDYEDPWDTMSTWDGCFIASDSNYTQIGPGLNAANMRYMNWLDESRVWKPVDEVIDQEILLRPLHSTDLPGNLAAEIPGGAEGFIAEFRVPEDWDSAIPRAAVFVHRLIQGVSYRMHGTAGNSDLVVGDVLRYGQENSLIGDFTEITVVEINLQRHYAKIRVKHHPRVRVRTPDLVGTIFGGVAVDGGGFIFAGGLPHPVDPWGPLKPIAHQLAAYQSTRLISDPLVRIAAQKSALRQIVMTATRQVEMLDELESPMPQSKEKGPAPKTTQKKLPQTKKSRRQHPS